MRYNRGMFNFPGITERFVRYTAFDTMSDERAALSRRPSTDGQTVLLEALCAELREMGLEPYLGSESVVACHIEGNVPGTPVGFMAHVDTADSVEGNHVKAVLHEDYDGNPIELSGGVVIDPSEDPDLLLYKGRTIITSSGDTLLGSDDKAGVAAIMEAVQYMVRHPEFEHGPVDIFFTPDEETGHGTDKFPFDKLGGTVCYTIDGGREGEIELECFNASKLIVRFHGTAAHLGSGRGVIKNTCTAAAAFISSLPQAESPEATDGRYGYYCVESMKANLTEAELNVYIRDFDSGLFQQRCENVRLLAATVARLYGVGCDIIQNTSYKNMAEANSKNPLAVEAVYRAGEKLGMRLEESLIRGGTDGARLAEYDIAAPNLFTGGHNLHSLKEWVATDAMEHAAALMLGIIQEFAG